MDSPTRQRYEMQSKDLRVKIKSWEVDFCKAHNGNKPGRKDIKESEMSGTYKEYQRLRDILSGKFPPPTAPKTATDNVKSHRKRKSPEQPQQAPSQTPSTKRFKTLETPSSRRQHLGDAVALNMFTPGSGSLTPSLSRKLFDVSPAIPTSIGPTPQRDGRVLGLFDSLPFKDADIDSPCKPNGAVRLSDVIEAGRQAMATQKTPRKASRLSSDGQPGDSSAAALGRTPSSRHKRHDGGVGPSSSSSSSSPQKSLLLSTPLKQDGAGRVARTPGTSGSGSVSRLQFQTPAFLRRIPMPRINEDSSFVSPEIKMRLPRKPLLRGLSSVVADLRRMQEAELDEDLDALREAEMEMEGDGGPSKPVNRSILSDKSDPPAISKDVNNVETRTERQANDLILEEDKEKQALNLLGGFDDEGDYDSAGEQDAGLDRNGNPLRVYKKKGQKRTTRKSNMKPVMKRRATTTAAATAEVEEEGEEKNASARRPDEPTADDSEGQQDDDTALHSGSDFVASDDEDELAQDVTATTTKKRGRPPAAAAAKKAASTRKKKTTAAATAPAGPAAKKPARKVNEHAHANFKRLKLRNSGAKGGPGHNSRFRRRR
ncbi:unnamed protein product [Discula destructiva]